MDNFHQAYIIRKFTHNIVRLILLPAELFLAGQFALPPNNAQLKPSMTNTNGGFIFAKSDMH